MGEIPIIGKKRNETKNEYFLAGFTVGLKTYVLPNPFGAPNKESAAAALGAIVTANFPNVSGFELYRVNPEYENDRELLMIAPIMQLMNWAGPQLQQLTGQQVLKAAVPVRQTPANGENLQKLMESAKKAGQQVL